MVDPVHRGNRMDHANITLTSIHSDSTGPTHLSCVRAYCSDLVALPLPSFPTPHDLLSEKVDRQCLGKVPALCGFAAEGAQPGNGWGFD